MLIFVIFTYLILIFFVLLLGCVNKIQHLINVKLVSNTDVNPIFILNQNATSVQRQPDVILTSCACWAVRELHMAICKFNKKGSPLLCVTFLNFKSLSGKFNVNSCFITSSVAFSLCKQKLLCSVLFISLFICGSTFSILHVAISHSLWQLRERGGKGKWCVAKYGDPYSEFVLCI